MAGRRLLLLLLGTLALCACNVLQLNRSRVMAKYQRAGLAAHQIMLSSGSLHYYEGGSGPTVLLIHGFAFGALETWEYQVAAFTRTHHVIAPDLYWFGSSVPAGGMDDAEQQARALSELLVRLGVERADVVGVSFGGYVALRLGLEHPDQVNHLVLADAAGIAPTAEETRAVTANFGGKQHLAELLVPRDLDDLRSFLRTILYKPRYIPKCVLRQILEQEFWQYREVKQRMCVRMEATGGFLAPAQVEGLRPSTLLIWGRHDPLVLPSIGARLQAALPRARLIYFEQSKHTPMREEPARFNDEVLRFLAVPP